MGMVEKMPLFRRQIRSYNKELEVLAKQYTVLHPEWISKLPSHKRRHINEIIRWGETKGLLKKTTLLGHTFWEFTLFKKSNGGKNVRSILST